jgi:hypothetical protein
MRHSFRGTLLPLLLPLFAVILGITAPLHAAEPPTPAAENFNVPPRIHTDYHPDFDSIRISLLTVSAGPEVYERFGHTAIRISRLPRPRHPYEPVLFGYEGKTRLEVPLFQREAAAVGDRVNQDLVFHYGVFNFNAPNFVYRFVKGETDYRIGCLPYIYMREDYEQRGLRMTEQVLNLTPEQSREVLRLLLINYLPENRTYRYSFFFDNCATRPFHLIGQATEGTLSYHPDTTRHITLRDMLREKTGHGTWLDFGISMVIAGRADCEASFEEQMFLPEYLMEAYSHAETRKSVVTTDSMGVSATVDTTEPWVRAKRVILSGNPSIRARLESGDDGLFSPMLCACLLLALAILFTWAEWGTRRRFRAFDALLFGVIGVAGIMVWFLNFCSLHPAVDHNWNCLWLTPTHLLFIGLLWIKKCKKIVEFYFFITFVALIVYLLIVLLGCQFAAPAFIPIVLALALRSFVLMRRSRCNRI